MKRGAVYNGSIARREADSLPYLECVARSHVGR
jgi:hypothetical protein